MSGSEGVALVCGLTSSDSTSTPRTLYPFLMLVCNPYTRAVRFCLKIKSRFTVCLDFFFPTGNKKRLIPFAINKVTSWGPVFLPHAGLKAKPHMVEPIH